jgi:hypothetical protein
MLHVNDDSNDELFRKAADDYFLGAGNPDFDKFIDSGVTTVTPSAVETVAAGAKRKHRYLFPFFGWAHSKIIYNWYSSFLRWQGKTKKKIEPGFMPMRLYCWYNKSCIGTII